MPDHRDRPLASLVATPAAGFEQPFEMLHACHERIVRTLGLLQRLRLHMVAHGADEQARQAAADVMRYFDLAAPQHHRDEELHVFPPLLAAGDGKMQALVRQLQLEHVQMAQRWSLARGVLDAIAQGQLNALTAQDETTLEAFAALHSAHLVAEEGIAYPAAGDLLDLSQVAAMGREMGRRRGAV